jgi:predicted nucleic acid-binding protein
VIVADTSALITLTAADTLGLLLEEFDVHTTETVIEELEDLASYGDETADHADTVLGRKDRVTSHSVDTPECQSSRIDDGEGSCIQLTRNNEADFLITDDLRALPELQTLTETRIAISPIVLKALVERGVLTQEGTRERLENAAEERDWLEAPIYRRARGLFDE